MSTKQPTIFVYCVYCEPEHRYHEVEARGEDGRLMFHDFIDKKRAQYEAHDRWCERTNTPLHWIGATMRTVRTFHQYRAGGFRHRATY